MDRSIFSQDRSALEAAFALIAEAISYLGDGSELGFGSLPDPARWLAELEAPVAVLTPPMLIDAAALADTAAMLRDAFRESRARRSRSHGAAISFALRARRLRCGSAPAGRGHSPRRAAQRRNQRRRFSRTSDAFA